MTTDYTIGTFIDPNWNKHPLAQGDDGFPTEVVDKGHAREGEFNVIGLSPMHIGYEHEINEGFTLFVYQSTGSDDDGNPITLKPMCVVSCDKLFTRQRGKFVRGSFEKFAFHALASAELWFDLRKSEHYS